VQFKKIVIPYVIKGVLIGLFFPLLALFICIYFLYPEGYQYTLVGLHKDFPLLWIIDSAPFVLGIISFFVGTDVNRLNNKFLTEIKEANEALVLKNNEQKSLIKEKEVLLKEVHHRVKNNLQVVTSLLSLQGRFSDNSQTEILFKNCKNRIKSMSMIHEMLYKSHDVSKINYEDYINKLISELIASMKGEEHNVELKIDVQDVRLDINTSIPLSLLVNEIVTNSLKYGIIGDSPGCIYFKMKKCDSNKYNILIGDNGIGFEDEINFENTSTLGLKLINRLITQLKGSIKKIKEKKGTHYTITFQEID
jgi:two-component sensor histidine kinase